jgi:transposase
VDFAYVGEVLEPVSGVRRKAWVFVMTLGYSRHFFARVVYDQSVPTWLDLHVRAFAFFRGVPRAIVPDNLKAAVIRVAFGVDEDIEVQRSYRDLARHYGFLIDPAPPRSPKKKGKVERNIQYVESFLESRRPDMDIDALNADLLRWNLEIAALRMPDDNYFSPLTTTTFPHR